MMRAPSFFIPLALAIVLAPSAPAYTVLTHEAVIDSVWDAALKPALLKRFPNATPEQLVEAHAYAYGGCIIQDLGYYPFSDHKFSDFTHYIRTGDFITALIRESHNVNEYAFALGGLEHYAADIEGHRTATNRAVPLLYPKLRAKFGTDVTYWDDPKSHLRTEFAFDVLQVAAGRYAPDHYRDFIGFKISKDVLERAFFDTYNLKMKDLFANLDLALGTYRWTIHSIIPGMTGVAWSLKHEELQKEIPGITRQKFLYNLSRASYEKEFGKEYQKPGLRTRLLSLLIRILPGKGPFTALHIPTPTPEVEKLFMASFNSTIDRYKAELAATTASGVKLPNENFDASEPVVFGKYQGADEAYAALLKKLADQKFTGITPALRQNILAYYAVVPSPSTVGTAKDQADRAKLVELLDQLKRLEIPQ